MLRICKSTLSWGGVAAAAILLTLGAPRAAYAVAASLVQVTNTASSPVIAQGIGNQAAQIVQIECGDLPGTQTNSHCFPMPASGVVPPDVGGYRLPTGQTLVVTSVDILSGAAAGSPCMSSALVSVVTSGSSYIMTLVRKSWIVPSGAGTAHYVYPSGILVASNRVGIDTIIESVESNSPCTITLDMHGYLTAN